jgi:hypothetical protein
MNATPRSLLLALLCSSPVLGQIGGNGSDGPLAPTSNLTLNTSTNGGVFQFTHVTIPAGVTVTLVGPNPATILSQGAVDISGTLNANGTSLGFNTNNVPGAGGPGGFAGGQGGLAFGGQWYGTNGQGPGGGYGPNPSTQPTKGGGGGGHGTAGQPGSSPWGGGAGGAAYGASLPFDLVGGSGGGGGYQIGYPSQYCGAGGGGALAIISDNIIQVAGTVSANGGNSEFLVTGTATSGPFGGGGAGGAILLRSSDDVAVLPGGVVTAIGGVGINLLFGGLQIPSGGEGLIRIDVLGSTPTIQGTVQPAPLLASLPSLRTTATPQIGTTWRVYCATLPGDIVFFFLAFQGANIPLPPFGTLLIDPSAGLLGSDMASPGIDPLAHADLVIPNNPVFIGFQLHSQAMILFAHPSTPQLTNAVVGVVQ